MADLIGRERDLAALGPADEDKAEHGRTVENGHQCKRGEPLGMLQPRRAMRGKRRVAHIVNQEIVAALQAEAEERALAWPDRRPRLELTPSVAETVRDAQDTLRWLQEKKNALRRRERAVHDFEHGEAERVGGSAGVVRERGQFRHDRFQT